MNEKEAYEVLAEKCRAKLSERKSMLYAEIRRIEELDELKGKELVRAAGENLFVSLSIGDVTVRAICEQPDAFRINRNSYEWRGYIDEVIGLLMHEQSEDKNGD